MALKTIKNPNKEIYDEVCKAVAENSGFCPCSLEKTKDTLCPCREFREQTVIGECHCGRFCKVEEN